MAKAPKQSRDNVRIAGLRRLLPQVSNGNGSSKRRAEITPEVRLALNHQEMVGNALFQRSEFMKQLLESDGKDINAECGYPDDIGPADYQAMYDREGIAARVVDVFPEESWSADLMVYETEDAEQTAWEKAFTELEQRLNLFAELEKLDKISGIGRYGVMLLGFNDGGRLEEAMAGVPENGKIPDKVEPRSKAVELLFVRSFSEAQAEIASLETDVTSPRFGQPTSYKILLGDDDEEDTVFSDFVKQLGASTSDGIIVHWTRVLHVADNCLSGRVWGTPRQQQVYNRLLDLRKVLGGSAEMHWKGGFPGYAFNIDSEVDPDSIDKEAMRAEFEAYQLHLQRYLAMVGVDVTSLAVQIADPTPHVTVAIEAICITKGIPKRIFMGSERGELASSQDEKAWSKRMNRRQDKHITPYIVRPFVDRMMMVGVLEFIEDVQVWWSSLFEPTDEEKADVSTKIVTAMKTYVEAGIDSTLLPPRNFLIDIMGFDAEMVDEWLEAVEEHVAELEKEAARLAEQGLDADGNPLPQPTPAAEQDVEEGIGAEDVE